MGAGRSPGLTEAQGAPPGSTGAVAPPFVGRERELLRLDALAEVVSGGHGRVVVVSGGAGIGKSRLAAEVLAGCAARGFGVFSAAADEVQQSRPFGVVADALGVHRGGDRVAEIRRLLSGDVAAGAGGLGLEWRIAELLVAVVREACEARPVVVVLDDLQWADESSLVAVGEIARLASSCPVLLLCVLRSYPASRALGALLASLDYRRADRVVLEGLASSEVAELAGVVAGAQPGQCVRRALGETAGNPFYVSALLRCLLAEGGAGVSVDGVLELTGEGLPPSLRLTVLEQLRFLPEWTLEVLRAGAVAGRVFSIAEAALISPSSVADVVQALGPAQRAGIVVADGERLSFRHDLIREAIYEDLAISARRVLHRSLASGLARSGAGSERVAAQLMLGAEPGDVEAVGWLRSAASEVRASSPAIAADLLWRALELAVEHGSVRMGVLVDLVRPLLWTGQAAKAEQVCIEALDANPPAGETPLFWLGLADARLLQGRFADARATSEQAIEHDELTNSDRLHMRTLHARTGVFLGDPQGLDAARELAATAPRSISKGGAQQAIAEWELFAGHADRALAAFERVESMRAPAQLESRIWEGGGIRVRMWEALALLDLDRLQDAVELLEQEIASKRAVPGLAHAFLAACRYHSGQFDQALHECRAAIATAEAAASFIPASAPALAATIALRQGRVEDAERLIEQAEHARTPVEPAGDTIARWTRTLLLEAAGQTQQAADEATGALAAYQRAGFVYYVCWHAPDLVRVSLQAGRPEQAALAVGLAERAAEQLPVPSRRAGALRARGLLADNPSILEQALTAARAAARPIDLALALRDTAAALARNGQQQDAKPLASEAVQLLGALGAVGEERNARKLLRAAGLALSARAKHIHQKHGWASLTEAELKIVALTAQGRSNPEIAEILYLSPRTVAWHLSNIFRKLDLTSRGALTAEAVRRGIG